MRLFHACTQLLACLVLVSSQAAAQLPAAKRALLLKPDDSYFKTHAPDTVSADIETTKGTFTLQLVRAWAPVGVDRFYNLARAGYYDDTRFYRVVYAFVAQFGTSSNPAITKAWAQRFLPADPPREKNTRGMVSFAQGKPTQRATTIFINLSDNPALDTLKFAPIARVTAGMDVVDSLYTAYGERTMSEYTSDQKRLYNEGNKYLDEQFPKLDRIIRITVKQP